MYTAFDFLGYYRRTSKKKGYLEDLAICAECKAFIEEGNTWSRERVRNQIFLDEL